MYKNEYSRKFIEEFESIAIKEKISQRKLSILIGMSPQTVTQIKKGRQSVQTDILKNFSDKFGYDLSYFYDEKKDDQRRKQINEQFELIQKNSEMLAQLFQTGIELTNSQLVYMKNLKLMMD